MALAARISEPPGALPRLPVPLLRLGSAAAGRGARRRRHAHAARARTIPARVVGTVLCRVATTRVHAHRTGAAGKRARPVSRAVRTGAVAAVTERGRTR